MHTYLHTLPFSLTHINTSTAPGGREKWCELTAGVNVIKRCQINPALSWLERQQHCVCMHACMCVCAWNHVQVYAGCLGVLTWDRGPLVGVVGYQRSTRRMWTCTSNTRSTPCQEPLQKQQRLPQSLCHPAHMWPTMCAIYMLCSRTYNECGHVYDMSQLCSLQLKAV